MHSAIPCLCTLPAESLPEGLPLGDFMFVQGDAIDILNFDKNPLNYSASYFKNWSFV